MTPAKGNKNSLKHGLYAKRITGEDKTILDKLSYSDLTGEIAYLRLVCSRIATILEKRGLDANEKNLPAEDVMKVFNSLTLAFERLNTLIRTHAILNGELKDLEKEIEEGKFLARTYFGVYEYLTDKKQQSTKRTSKKG